MFGLRCQNAIEENGDDALGGLPRRERFIRQDCRVKYRLDRTQVGKDCNISIDIRADIALVDSFFD